MWVVVLVQKNVRKRLFWQNNRNFKYKKRSDTKSLRFLLWTNRTKPGQDRPYWFMASYGMVVPMPEVLYMVPSLAIKIASVSARLSTYSIPDFSPIRKTVVERASPSMDLLQIMVTESRLFSQG